MSLLDVWVLFLVVGTVAIFVAGVWVVTRVSRRHKGDDPRAGAKAGIAILFSVVLGLGGLVVLHDFQGKGVEGIHKTFVSGLNLTMGDGDWWDAVKTINKRIDPATGSIPTIIGPGWQKANDTLAAYFAAHPGTNATSPSLPPSVAENVTAQQAKSDAFYGAWGEVNAAVVKLRMLTPNHALWLKVRPLVTSGQDDKAEDMVLRSLDPAHVADPDLLPLDDATAATNAAPCQRSAQTGLCTAPLQPKALEHSFFDAHLVRSVPYSEGGPEAFDHLRQFNTQMDTQLKWFAYPDLTGLVAAPLVFAAGSVLRRAYVPSETVGFRPYPSKAAGFFLLVMGGMAIPSILLLHEAPTLDLFGILAIPFAAWVLRDLHKRSVEGQIEL